jgi:hypothetical protein
MFTRSGRVIKKPVAYVPTEEVMDDDFSDNDYNSSSSVGSNDSDEVKSVDNSSESEADSKGNVNDLVNDSDCSSAVSNLSEESDYEESDSESSGYPLKKKKNLKKTITIISKDILNGSAD